MTMYQGNSYSASLPADAGQFGRLDDVQRPPGGRPAGLPGRRTAGGGIGLRGPAPLAARRRARRRPGRQRQRAQQQRAGQLHGQRPTEGRIAWAASSGTTSPMIKALGEQRVASQRAQPSGHALMAALVLETRCRRMGMIGYQVRGERPGTALSRVMRRADVAWRAGTGSSTWP